MKASFLTRLFDLMAPRLCPVCGHRLSVTESLMCPVCMAHLPLTRFELSPADNEMARRFWGLLPLEHAAALFFYEPQSECANLIYQLKYYGRPDIGRKLGTLTARRFACHGFFRGIDAIVPVPLSRMRQWHRGYNQSMEIAKGVAEEVGLPIYNNVVRRVQFDKSQTRLSHWQRQANTQKAFRLTCADRVEDRHLLLIDDVVTTGSTLLALGEELLLAGNVTLSILSIGYTKS